MNVTKGLSLCHIVLARCVLEHAVEREFGLVGGLVRHAEPCHDERQDSADDRTEVYQEGLYHVALCLLRIVEHVGHQRSEGLHRDVERQIHEQQDESPHGEWGEGEQFGAVGHEH